jgi:hypothetical protein
MGRVGRTVGASATGEDVLADFLSVSALEIETCQATNQIVTKAVDDLFDSYERRASFGGVLMGISAVASVVSISVGLALLYRKSYRFMEHLARERYLMRRQMNPTGN